MEMSVEQEGPVSRMTVVGELTIYAAAECKSQILDAVERGESVEVVAEGITELDTAGVQLLLLAKRMAVKAGKSFRVVSPSAVVEDVLRTLALSHTLESV